MKYVTGIPALNLHDQPTPGDWHYSCVDWENLSCAESDESVFGEWDIRMTDVPHNGTCHAASHARACLDLLECGKFASAGGMRRNYLDDDSLNEEIFEHVELLRNSATWPAVERFMGKEYGTLWLRHVREGDNRTGTCG